MSQSLENEREYVISWSITYVYVEPQGFISLEYLLSLYEEKYRTNTNVRNSNYVWQSQEEKMLNFLNHLLYKRTFNSFFMTLKIDQNGKNRTILRFTYLLSVFWISIFTEFASS